MVTCDHFIMGFPMRTFNLKDAKATFSSLLDEAVKGRCTVITRHGKPAAALVSIEAAA